jgi:hypothetical protein
MRAVRAVRAAQEEMHAMIIPNLPTLYHETQVASECGMHAINNMFEYKIVGKGTDGDGCADMLLLDQNTKTPQTDYNNFRDDHVLNAIARAAYEKEPDQIHYISCSFASENRWLSSSMGRNEPAQKEIMYFNPNEGVYIPREFTNIQPFMELFIDFLNSPGRNNYLSNNFRMLICLEGHYTAAIYDGVCMRYHESLEDNVLFFNNIDDFIDFLLKKENLLNRALLAIHIFPIYDTHIPRITPLFLYIKPLFKPFFEQLFEKYVPTVENGPESKMSPEDVEAQKSAFKAFEKKAGKRKTLKKVKKPRSRKIRDRRQKKNITSKSI